MIPLQAEIWTSPKARDGRRAARRALQLEVQALAAAEATKALIHDLSETGLLIETAAAIEVDDTLQVELPEMGSVDARIVWTRGSFFGCEFASPVSKAVVSAALLRSPIKLTANPAPAEIASTPKRADDDYPTEVATTTSMAEVTAVNQTALGLSLVLLLAVVVLFLIALVSSPQ